MTPTLHETHLGETLDGLLDGTLSTEAANAARAHLSACDDCSARFTKLSGAVAAVQGLGRARAPEGFGARVLKRVRSQRRAGLRRPGLDQKLPFEGVIVLILAAAAAAVLIGYGIHESAGLFAKNAAAPKAEATPTARP